MCIRKLSSPQFSLIWHEDTRNRGERRWWPVLANTLFLFFRSFGVYEGLAGLGRWNEMDIIKPSTQLPEYNVRRTRGHLLTPPRSLDKTGNYERTIPLPFSKSTTSTSSLTPPSFSPFSPSSASSNVTTFLLKINPTSPPPFFTSSCVLNQYLA